MSEKPKLHVLYAPVDEHEAEAPGLTGQKKSCAHKHVRLEVDARRVFCRDCGDTEVDAFTILHSFASDWTRVTRWRQEAERRRKLAADRLVEIQRLEKNARARIKKLGQTQKLPEKGWDETGEIW